MVNVCKHSFTICKKTVNSETFTQVFIPYTNRKLFVSCREIHGLEKSTFETLIMERKSFLFELNKVGLL